MWYSKYTTIVTTYSQIDFNLMASCEKNQILNIKIYYYYYTLSYYIIYYK